MNVTAPFRKQIIPATVTAVLIFGAAGLAASSAATQVSGHTRDLTVGEQVPTGARITPTAAPGSIFEGLNPDLESFPDYLADHAVKNTISPDGTTMLVLTSGYNRMYDVNGDLDPSASNEYVFIYDISGGAPVKAQVLQVPNTFNGIAWHPKGTAFYVSGGVDDNVHTYTKNGNAWMEAGNPIPLGHDAGLDIGVRPLAAGVAVSKKGDRLLVANYENDSVSLVDLNSRMVIAELDMRPGVIDPEDEAVPGGEYPFAVIFKGNEKAYVTSQRDREVVVLKVENSKLAVESRIPVAGQPTNMLLDQKQQRLFIACDNSDSVVVIDTGEDELLEVIPTLAPKAVFANPEGFRGANPNGLALSPDEDTLFAGYADVGGRLRQASSYGAFHNLAKWQGREYSEGSCRYKTQFPGPSPWRGCCKSLVCGLD